ncbi:MAG TPA: histone deacetylase [Syntrophobacteraceae bacterium]|nr:histone deacetylase [Syntrophobacteraceae bacterium]
MGVTGIFYHPSFSRRSYLTQGSRLQDFPHALEPLLSDSRYRLYESPAIADEWILKVHAPELIEEVKMDQLCSTAWHSVGGVVLAAETIACGEIDNAFAFIGAGGHHSGRDFFGGYCCFNDVVIAIQVLRSKYPLQRFAILDTDAHHGDGTRELVKDDADVLHVCMCGSNYCSRDETKVDVASPHARWLVPGSYTPGDVDDEYASAAIKAFVPRAARFRPDLIFWYFGFDTHRGDYGSLGLTGRAYQQIGRSLHEASEAICSGRIAVVLGGGSRSDLARTLIPPIISILGENNS